MYWDPSGHKADEGYGGVAKTTTAKSNTPAKTTPTNSSSSKPAATSKAASTNTGKKTEVKINVPNKGVVTGYVQNGSSYLSNGSPVPVGAIVTLPSGDKWLKTSGGSQKIGVSCDPSPTIQKATQQPKPTASVKPPVVTLPNVFVPLPAGNVFNEKVNDPRFLGPAYCLVQDTTYILIEPSHVAIQAGAAAPFTDPINNIYSDIRRILNNPMNYIKNGPTKNMLSEPVSKMYVHVDDEIGELQYSVGEFITSFATILISAGTPIKEATMPEQLTPKTPPEGAGSKNVVGSNHNTIKPTQDVVNPQKVADYAQRLQAGEKLPCIEVVEVPGKGMYILEGHHRYVASQQTGIPVEIKVVPGQGPVGMPDWSGVQWKEYISESQFWGD